MLGNDCGVGGHHEWDFTIPGVDDGLHTATTTGEPWVPDVDSENPPWTAVNQLGIDVGIVLKRVADEHEGQMGMHVEDLIESLTLVSAVRAVSLASEKVTQQNLHRSIRALGHRWGCQSGRSGAIVEPVVAGDTIRPLLRNPTSGPLALGDSPEGR